MTRLKQLKGFTLIELIVVVIIIGVLAAIAAVAYNQFVANARSTAAKADAAQVVTEVSAYGQQNDLSASQVLDGTTTGPDGTVALDAVKAQIQGDVTLGALSTTFTDANDSNKPYAKTVLVAVGKNLTNPTTAKHSCVLDVNGDLPVIIADTCK